LDLVIESISTWPTVRLRHEAAPLLKEREQYLAHLLRQGFSRKAIRSTAAYLIHIVRVMNMTALRSVRPEEINTAGQLWVAYERPHRTKILTQDAIRAPNDLLSHFEPSAL